MNSADTSPHHSGWASSCRLVSCYRLVRGEGGNDVSNYLRVRMPCHRVCITEDSTTLEWGLNVPPQHGREGSILFQWMKCLWNALCMWTSAWLSSACSTTCSQQSCPCVSTLCYPRQLVNGLYRNLVLQWLTPHLWNFNCGTNSAPLWPSWSLRRTYMYEASALCSDLQFIIHSLMRQLRFWRSLQVQ